MWLRSLSTSIKIKINKPLILYEDNQSCKYIAENFTCHSRLKHFEVKYHFNRTAVQNKIIKIVYIPTDIQIADTLTKPLAKIKFLKLREGLSLK